MSENVLVSNTNIDIPNGLISAVIEQGSIIVNDYVIRLEQATDGYELIVTKGSQEQRAYLYGMTDERMQIILEATRVTEQNKDLTVENEAKVAVNTAQALQYRNNCQNYAISANQDADDARDSELAAERYAELASQRAYGVSVESNTLSFSNIEETNQSNT